MPPILRVAAQPFFTALGAVFRRWWGGWNVPPHMVKVIVGFVLAYLMVAMQVGFTYKIGRILFSELWFTAWIGAAFMNPLHSWGMGMGYDAPGKSTLACTAVMGGSYGAFTSIAAAGLCFGLHDLGFAFYALMGFLVPVPYILAWMWAVSRGYNSDKTKMQFLFILNNWFIDSPTAIGECFLGALLLSLWHV